MEFGRKVKIVIYHGKKRVSLGMMNFMGFAVISSKNGRKSELIWKKGLGMKNIRNTFGGDTEEWKEATKKAHEMSEELRVQFELKNSYGELRNQLEEWEEDKQWKAREESNRRANLERNLPAIPEVEEFEDFDNAISHDFGDFDTQSETKDLISDSPMETENLQNFGKARDQLSAPERLVTDEEETSENTELGAGEDPSLHVGSEIAPSELIEFDNNLAGVGKFSGGRNGEKDVLAPLALMEEMIANQCMVKRRKNEDAKLIAGKAVLKVNEANKIRELYRIMNEIPESQKEKNCELSNKLRRNGANGIMSWMF